MNLSLWFSRRLRGGSTAGRTGTVIAVAGVALALFVMEITLAVVVGFKHGITDKLTGFDAEITVHAPYTGNGDEQAANIAVTDTLMDIIAACTGDAEVSLAIRQPGILKTDNDFQGVVFLAREAGSANFERSMLTAGEWPDFDADSSAMDIVLPEPLAMRLGVGVGDRIFSTFIIDENVRLRRHTVRGLFKSNFADYDASVAYVSMKALRGVAGMGASGAARIDIRGIDDNDIADVAERLQIALLDAAADGKVEGLYPVSTIEQTGAMYYNWLALLDTNVVVIFILMLAVAAFTLISSLFILILEHIPTIGVLRALGASKLLIRRIFVDTGMRLVLYGMIAGNIIGISLILLQNHYHFLPLDPEMYYLSWVPMEFRPLGVLSLNAGVAAVAWLILAVPARTAAAVDPASAIKYE